MSWNAFITDEACVMTNTNTPSMFRAMNVRVMGPGEVREQLDLHAPRALRAAA